MTAVTTEASIDHAVELSGTPPPKLTHYLRCWLPRRSRDPSQRPSPFYPVLLLALAALILVACEEAVPPEPAVGAIAVNSEPSGARVFFDGSDTGRVTPYTVPDVAAGSHTIRLTLEGYEDWGPEAVEVARGQTTPVNAALVAHDPSPPPEPVGEHALGLIPLDVEAYRNAQILRADPIPLPRSVDLSPDIPRPGSQGQQGSCVGWAVAYALKTYHERTERGWPLNDYRHIMSPAYIYNQIKVPGPTGGAYLWEALDLLVNEGVSSWTLMPYNELDDNTLPSPAAIEEAANYRIAEWGTVQRGVTNDAFVQELKRHVAGGRPVLLSMRVYSDFDLLSSSNPVYDSNRGPRRGYHAITMVGYDDRLSAFKIINSWGTDWGIGGYGWIAYEALEWAVRGAYVTRDIVAVPDPDPPEAVSDPSPQNGTINVPTDATLSWTRNARTSSFDVYLGTSSALTVVDLQSTVAQSTFSPILAPGSRYYWRVDARGAGGLTAGPVWSFTTVEPPPAPEPPAIVRHPAPITFSSPSAAAQTRMLSDYIRGSTSYEVQTRPAGIVTTRVAGHRLTVAPQAAGTAVVRIQGTNEDGSSPWLSMNVTVTAPPPDPPVIISYPRSITFSSPSASAQTIVLNTYIRGAITYDVNVTPTGIVTRTLTGHRLTITPRAAGTATVQLRGNNGDGSSDWLPISVVVTAPPPPPPSLPGLSIVDMSGPEEDEGTTTFTFLVTLDAPSTRQARAFIRTVAGTAVAGDDFESRSGWVSFSPGRTIEMFEVRVYGDTEVEQDELFQVVVEQVENAAIVDGTATGTIVNDDVVTFGSQTIPDIVTTVDAGPDRVLVTLPTATGGDAIWHQMRGATGERRFYPPGVSIGRWNGEYYLVGPVTAAHDATTYVWQAVRSIDGHVFDSLEFTITIHEGSYPVPRFDRHNDPVTSTFSVSIEDNGAGEFGVLLPRHFGGKEPFDATIEPLIPGCGQVRGPYLTIPAYVDGNQPNRIRCHVDGVILDTAWTTTYTVTDVHGDSDSVELTLTFVP